MVRTIAAATAAVLVALLVYTTYLAATGDDLVVPSNGVTGRETADDPAEGAAGYQALQERTALQRWRSVSGPSPGQSQPPAQTAGTPGEARTAGDAQDVAAPRGPALVQDWLGRREGQTDILQDQRFVSGVTSVPGPVKGVFVQPQGRAWRSAHNGPIVFGGALYMLGVAALLAVFLSIRGRVPLKEGFSGRTVERFNAFERANHWMTAGSFVVLALTGLVVLYGKSVIRPWLGADTFDDLAEGSVWAHMALILPFALGLLVMIGSWTLQNLPKRIDWQWLKQGGGLFSDDSPNPPAERFNAGQKLIFWAVILGGLILIVSGLAMMFPFLWAGYGGMLFAQSVHAIAALVMIGIIFGHIYIGTVGMVGAFEAMWSGQVDRNWAEEHHNIWYRRLTDSGSGSKNQPAE